MTGGLFGDDVYAHTEKIVRMAREAGMHYSGACTLTGMESHLARFAAAIAADAAAHEREALVKEFERYDLWGPMAAKIIQARGQQ